MSVGIAWCGSELSRLFLGAGLIMVSLMIAGFRSWRLLYVIVILPERVWLSLVLRSR